MHERCRVAQSKDRAHESQLHCPPCAHIVTLKPPSPLHFRHTPWYPFLDPHLEHLLQGLHRLLLAHAILLLPRSAQALSHDACHPQFALPHTRQAHCVSLPRRPHPTPPHTLSASCISCMASSSLMSSRWRSHQHHHAHPTISHTSSHLECVVHQLHRLLLAHVIALALTEQRPRQLACKACRVRKMTTQQRSCPE